MWQLSSIEALQQQRLLLQLEYFTVKRGFPQANRHHGHDPERYDGGDRINE